ncbi:MAG: alpha-amylase [Akkermansia sp.]|nr:alpha-amylase [Akkermansia sp.]
MKNGVMMQYFEWNLPNTGTFWKQLEEDAAHLAQIGISAVWLPPAYKATEQGDVGYGCYDLYDLGEFDQKGTTRTKYGTKEELLQAIDALHAHGICVYPDVVMNHKAGADSKERFRVKEVGENNRDCEVSDAYEIEGWTGFHFPGRKGKYSAFTWHWYHFTATDYDAGRDNTAIYKIEGEGKEWSHNVDGENGNYDYLMFANIDYHHPDVVEEMKRWGIWFARATRADGFRLDAIKHINADFIRDFIATLRADRGEKFYFVGEYWKDSAEDLEAYLAAEDYSMDLFDVSLHYNFATASEQGEAFDLRTLRDGTLVMSHPALAVTFVDNHDSQPGQSLESTVADWFKPAAYALILLQQYGYPCVFYGDYYGIGGQPPVHRTTLDILLGLRRTHAHGPQEDYFDAPGCVGFVRLGTAELPHSGLALLISHGQDCEKQMHLGPERAGQLWVDALGTCPEPITIDASGNALFRVPAGKVAVWVQKMD